jgi:putative ATP-dependent endonuclease of the OLD family
MRVVRITVERFRGFENLEVYPRDHLLVIGEPRAGRTTLVDAARAVLDPAFTRARPSLWDVYRPLTAPGADGSYPLTTVELAIVGLDATSSQTLDRRLELLDPATGEIASAATPGPVMGVRVRYCLRLNPDDESLDHWVEYSASHARLPRDEREILRASLIDAQTPLQLRAQGGFRQLAELQDPGRISTAVNDFACDVSSAAGRLSTSAAVGDALDAIEAAGGAIGLGLPSGGLRGSISFATEDGSVNGLLRSIQPIGDFDSAGDLPLRHHGSTASSVLSTAEALARSTSGRLLLGDDYADQLDGASAEVLARLIRESSSQSWLSSRRAEVVAAFDADEVVRLTRRHGATHVHVLAPIADRQERIRRRYLAQLLAPALSSRTVALVEGPHDVEAYAAMDARLHALGVQVPLAGHSTRLLPVSATGDHGGKSRIPELAKLAVQLGFVVFAVLDGDSPGDNDDLIAELGTIGATVVALPPRSAVEAAITRGVPATALRAALHELDSTFGLALAPASLDDNAVERTAVTVLKMKGGLHRQFVDALPDGVLPALAAQLLAAVKTLPAAPGVIQL